VKTLTAPTKKPITLAPIRPNIGIQLAFQMRLDALIAKMNRDTTRTILAAYKRRPPEMAQDASPAAVLRAVVRRLASEWNKRFSEFAESWGAKFAKDSAGSADRSFAAALRKAGFTVRFSMTREVNDITQAATASNVALIRSISSEFHKNIEGMVMRSVQVGRDVGGLTAELQRNYGVTTRRAAIIGRSQSNLATAAVTRARQDELGITTALWLHSSGGKTPRPSHVVNSGKPYDVKKGWYDPDEKKFILPGELINCFSEDTVIGLETRPTILWRAPFNGPMVHIRVGPDLLKGTPNHPILTSRGWLALNEVDRGDKVVCMARDQWNIVDDDEDNMKTTFVEFFESLRVMGVDISRNRRGFNFHGDIPNGDVNEISITDGLLNNWRQANRLENISQFKLSETDSRRSASLLRGINQIPEASLSSRGSRGSFLFGSLSRGPREIGIGTVSHHATPYQNIPDVPGRMTRDIQLDGDSRRSETIPVKALDLIAQRVPISPLVGNRPDTSDLFAEFVRVAAKNNRDILKFGAFFYEFRRVTDKSIGNCSGHVFTMETSTGHYSVGAASVQAKNCRCVSRSLIPGLQGY
jgi:hypothetical protein